MFTTAKAWKFTPSLPCCVPDTIDLNFITTQCTTVTSNRWRPVLTDSLGRASTTACDTISYLYVDTINYGVDMSGLYIPYLGTESGKFMKGIFKTDTVNFEMDFGNAYLNFVPLDKIEITFANSTFNVREDSIQIKSTGLSNKGITADSYYGANYTQFTYVQKKYVDDNFTPNSSILTDTATLNFGSIANNSYEDLTVTVTGASTGDVVSFGTPTAAAVAYATFTAWVSATDTVTIRCVNVHSSSIDPASGVFKVKVFKD
jgi:hypothetical protein